MHSLSIGDLAVTALACSIYLIPGLAISRRLTNRSGHLSRALPITICIHFVFYEYAHFVGIRQSNYITVALLVVSLGSLLKESSKAVPTPDMRHIASLAPSAAAGILMLGIWLHNSKAIGSIIPNHDAMNHSYMIKNIVVTGSQQVERASQLFPLGAGHAGTFYPLGEHSLIAAVVRLTNASISGQMNVLTFALSVALFPYFMMKMCERIIPGRSIVRLAAPIAVLLLMSTFPLSPLSWGGMAIIVAMAYVPAAAVAFADVLEDPSSRNLLLSAALFVGLFVMHNTEAITALLLGLLIHVCVSRGINFRVLVPSAIKIGLISMLALAPILGGLVGGAKDRNLDYQGVLDPGAVIADYLLHFFVGTPQYSLLILTSLSLVLVSRRVSSTFGVAYIILGATCVVAGLWPSSPLVRGILKPWYGQVLRINYNVVYLLVPLLAALTVVIVYELRGSFMRRIAAVTILVALALLGLNRSRLLADDLLGHWYRELVPNTSESLAAYRFMRNNSSGTPKAMTEADTTSDSTWMYAVAGVQPINATAMTGPGMDKYSDIKRKLLENIGHLGEHTEILRWVKQHEIEYFYFDESTNVISGTHQVTLEQLRSEPRLTEVFSSANAHVFRFG